MILSRVAVPVVGFASLIGAIAFTMGMSHPSASEPTKSSLRLDGKTEAALETLHQELQRRFHDRNDVDFGFSRLVRDGVRMHNRPPLMERERFFGAFKSPQPKNLRLVPASEGVRAHYEVNDPDLGWTNIQKLRPTMKAESEAERQAIETLRTAKADFAIYTFGLIGQEAIPPRAKGPGYLRQKSAEAPAADSLVKYAQQAWRSGSADTIVEGPDGWYLMAHRVKADTDACVSCHAHNSPDRTLGLTGQVPPSQEKLYKVGDDLGMVVIAVRPR